MCVRVKRCRNGKNNAGGGSEAAITVDSRLGTCEQACKLSGYREGWKTRKEHGTERGRTTEREKYFSKAEAETDFSRATRVT